MTRRAGDRPSQDLGQPDLALDPVGTAPPIPRRLPGADVILGRDAACDVVLDDSGVSRRHARIAWQDGVWWVHDLGSRNGTMLDDAPAQQAILADGATLRIGPFAWTVRLRTERTRSWPGEGFFVWKLTSDDARAGAVDRLLWSRQVVLGRSTTSDVVLPLDQVSALHARLAYASAGLVLTDLGSANGTRVNGVPVRTARLRSGDRLEIADVPLRVRRTWIPAPPLLGAAGMLVLLALVLVLMPTAGRRSLDLDRWWTRDMYLEQAERSLNEALAAWQRPQPARDLARARFDIALRSLAAVDYLPWRESTQADIAAALRRAQAEFGGPLQGHDLAAILQALDAPPPAASEPPAASAAPERPARPDVHPEPQQDPRPAPRPQSASPPYELKLELALIMAEFGIDTASQPIPPDLVAAIDDWIGFWSIEKIDLTRRAWQRGRRHLPLITQALRQHRLPEVFSYLPFIESAYQTDITSHAGARGLWQFMPATARQYGLRVDDQIDERTDPARSTEAACRYIEYLLNAYGANSFMCAIAAYNKGEHGLLRCLGRGADWRSRWKFWDIATRGDGCLKQETIEYVPKFLAAVVVLRRPDVFLREESGV
ncbi:MAG: FHA domain-containing protein [Candidatus Krumholzibacteria bacterium]|jgi:pSer/pThr/pTyr-binding forkhead associated (FHA) protein|nr:FHA domain-containing protein [Candidatus Krumholzibacteria bacterium]